jgi:hypothetical protein
VRSIAQVSWAAHGSAGQEWRFLKDPRLVEFPVRGVFVVLLALVDELSFNAGSIKKKRHLA